MGSEKKCEFIGKDKLYYRTPEGKLENEDYELLLDFSMRMDHEYNWRQEHHV